MVKLVLYFLRIVNDYDIRLVVDFTLYKTYRSDRKFGNFLPYCPIKSYFSKFPFRLRSRVWLQD